jgi:RNA polymerase sigma factor (sigma-70 family)
MENIESLIDEFKDLKSKDKGMTIDQFVAKQPPDVAEELASQLYFDKFEAWLKTTTKRRISDLGRKWRAQKRGGAVNRESLDDTTEDVKILISPATQEDDVIQGEIPRAFESLPEEEKQICFLYYVYGYNDREIGEKLKMKTNTVTVKRIRAIKKPREILRRWGYHE